MGWGLKAILGPGEDSREKSPKHFEQGELGTVALFAFITLAPG